MANRCSALLVAWTLPTMAIPSSQHALAAVLTAPSLAYGCDCAMARLLRSAAC